MFACERKEGFKDFPILFYFDESKSIWVCLHPASTISTFFVFILIFFGRSKQTATNSSDFLSGQLFTLAICNQLKP